MPGSRDDQVEPEHVHVRQRRTVERRVGDHARQVRRRVGPAVARQPGEVRHEVEHHLEDRVVLARPPDVRVLRAEQLLGELEHLGVVVLGQAEDREDHLKRVVHRDVAGEVALVTQRRHLVDILPGQLVDALRHALHVRRLEPVVDEVAMGLVLVAVHLHEALHRRPAPSGVALGVLAGGERGLRLVGEHLRVPFDLHDVGVLRDRPELWVVGKRHLDDGLLAPEERRRRVPGDGVGVRGRLGEDAPEIGVGGGHRGGGHGTIFAAIGALWEGFRPTGAGHLAR